MIENEGWQDEKDDCVVIATKVKRSVAMRLNHLCQKKDMKIYRMLRNCADTIVRYTDDNHNRTPEIEQAMEMFEHMDGWKSNFTLADPTAKPEVVGATYFLRDKNSKGERLVHVQEPFFGEWKQTYNVQEILEQTLNAVAPETYRHLRQVGVDMESTSVLQTLRLLIQEHVAEADLQAIRNGFEDDNYSEFGVKPYAGPTLCRKMHKDVESQRGLHELSMEE